MSYTVELTKSAAREFKKLERAIQVRVAQAIDALKDEPRPEGVRKLSGAENLWRVRVGDYRIIYSIEDDILLVTLVRVRHRRDAY
ncbi:MAG: type II toxin-antitoxin system RelE/ParE family toxin [Bradymonadaceae bacterium]|nr:type II toxin-antitoxin system RelE/ParE family toxin [Lujinxingiaceae bacterium]